MTDVWRIAVVILLLLAAVLGDVWWERWSFDECLRVGHSGAFCTVNYPFGAHR